MSEEDIQRYADEFPQLCAARHAMGAEKYGPVKFMEIDSVEMAIEELADLANYVLYTYVKLRMLQDALKIEPAQIVPGRTGFQGRSSS